MAKFTAARLLEQFTTFANGNFISNANYKESVTYSKMEQLIIYLPVRLFA